MHKKRTKIVCTIGPASSSEETLRKMVKAGMNVARLNFSHGTHDEHAALIKSIRKVSEELGEPVAILQDLQGPKIRVGVLPDEGVVLEAGGRVTFTTGEGSVKDMRLPVTYERLHQDVKPGERILLDDGLLSAKVLSVEGHDVICEVVDGGKLTSHKGVNFPESELTVSSLSAKDRDDVTFGIAQKVDWVALSFVKTAEDIRELRALLPKEDPPIRIIAKIEKPQAVKNIAEIVEAVDAIMVARGDLGIEMPAREVPVIQKMLVKRCLEAAKPVIVATQMLDSMIRNPRPTRAEVSDIANAVIDHTDAVMLSGETAGGKYPLESVQVMADIAVEIEDTELDDMEIKNVLEAKSAEDAVSSVAGGLAKGLGAKLILVATLSGDAARMVSRHRPELPIMAATTTERVRHQLSLSWGIEPFILPECKTIDELVKRGLERVKAAGHAVPGDKIVVVAGEPVGISGSVNLVEIEDVK